MRIRRSISGLLAAVMMVTALSCNAVPVFAMENDILSDELEVLSDSNDALNGDYLIEKPSEVLNVDNRIEEQKEIIDDELLNDSDSMDQEKTISGTIEAETYETDPELDADGNIASGTYGNVSWKIDNNRKLWVSGNGDFQKDSYSYSPWYDYRTQILSAEIDLIGGTYLDRMFLYCDNITRIEFKRFDTSKATDMSYMFCGCKKLETIDLSCFNTSKVTCMDNMFSECSSLVELNVNSFDTSSVQSMSGMFRNCSGLSSIDLSSFDTRKVVSMSDMFSGCSGLTTLDVSNFITSNVYSMDGLFCKCNNLTAIDVSNFDTSNVEIMGGAILADGMFEGCSSLITLILSNFDTSKVRKMGGMFYNCSSLKTLDISRFDTSNVDNMDSMFGGCKSLESLDVSGFNTSKVTDMSGMFASCESITSLDVSKFDTSNVKRMEYMFSGCNSLCTLDVSNFDTSQVEPSEPEGTINHQYTLNLDGSMYAMFEGCSQLKSLDLSSFDTSKVTNMAYMFYGCSSLESVNVSSFDTLKCSRMEGMFADCSALDYLDISFFDMSRINAKLKDFFSGCMKLTGVKSPKNVQGRYPIDLPGTDWKNSLTGEVVTAIPAGIPSGTLFTRDVPVSYKNTISVNRIGSGKILCRKYAGDADVSESEVLVDANENVVFVFEPDEGYTLDSLIVDGVELKNYQAKNYTFNDVKEDHILAVTFVLKKQIKGEFSYYSNISKVDYYSSNSEDYKRSYTYNFTDDWFLNDSHIYNHDLARMSLRTAMAAMDYGDGSVSSNRKTDNIKSLMNDLGFIYSEKYIEYPQPGTNTIGSAIGYKTINMEEKPATIILVAVRGGGYEKEWGGNFNVRNGYTLSNETIVDHFGFNLAASTVLNSLDSFVKENKENLIGDVKVWLVGYSRAAATANIAAARIIERNEHLENINNCGIDTSKGVFAYCFECPQNTEYFHADDKMYGCIFNIVNPLDFVPRVAMNNSSFWDYSRYGITYTFPSYLANSNYIEYYEKMTDTYLNDLKIPEISPEYVFEEWVFQSALNKLADLLVSPDVYYDFQDVFISVAENTLGKSEIEKVDNAVQKLFDGQFMCIDYNLQHVPKIKSKLEQLGDDAKFVHYQELCLAWMETISENDLKKSKYTRFGYINCPVNVIVKDSNGIVVGEIVDDTPIEIDDGVFTIVDDNGQKIFALPGDAEYSVEFSATGEGEMTYSIVEKQEGYDSTERVVTYADIDIEEGDSFTASIGKVPENSETEYKLYEGSEELIPSVDQKGDDIKYYTVDISAQGNGTVEGSGVFTHGQFDKLQAFPSDDSRFLGWEIDGSIRSTETEYRLEVIEDISGKGIFTDGTESTCYVGFDTQGGEPIKSIINVDKGSSINLATPVRDGCDFIGWFTEPNEKGEEFTEDSIVNNDMVLFAAWKQNLVEVQNITLSPTENTINVRESFEPRVHFSPKHVTDKTVSWSSDNEAVAVVSGNGVVTGKSEGTATITATTSNGKKAECKVTVTDGAAPQPGDWGDLENYLDIKKLFNNPNDIPTTVWYVFNGDDTVYKPNSSAQLTKVNKEHTGSAVIFNEEISVFYRNEKLLEGRDYKVIYGNNVDAAQASLEKPSPSLTIKGMGNSYKGSSAFRFSITKTDAFIPATDVKIACLNTEPEYTGNVLTLDDLYKADKSEYKKVTLYKEDADGSRTVLTEGTDYNFEDSQLRAAGTFDLKFKLSGNYKGTVISNQIKVVPYDVKAHEKAGDSKIQISYDKTTDYCKSGAEPKVTVMFNGRELTEGIDYRVNYRRNKRLGEGAKIKVIFYGYFKGTLTEYFETTRKSVSNLTVYADDIKWKNKQGNFKTLPRVMDGSKAVSKMRDIERFKITNGCEYYYAEGDKRDQKIDDTETVPAGTLVEVRISVKSRENGAYTGEAVLKGYYRVFGAENNIKKAKVTTTPIDYNEGKAITPVYIQDFQIVMPGETEPLDQQYFEITSVKQNRFIGTATVEVRGKNGYGGVKTFRIKIVKRRM